MRDNNLILTDSAVSADAFAANALAVNKTGVRGVWLQFHVTKTGSDSDERLDITVYGKDSDSSWATTDTPVAVTEQIGSGMSQNGVKVVHALVQAPFAYIKPYYNVSGTTPGFTIVCSVVSGPQRDTSV